MRVSDKWGVLKLILFNFLQVYELIYSTTDWQSSGKIKVDNEQ